MDSLASPMTIREAIFLGMIIGLIIMAMIGKKG
jgi:hypothetical protein